MDGNYLFVSLTLLGGICLYFGIGGMIADHLENRIKSKRGMATKIRKC